MNRKYCDYGRKTKRSKTIISCMAYFGYYNGNY